MRLGGRLSAAIDIVDDIETRRRPVTDALKDWGLSHRFAGAGDRAAIGNIVHDVLRRKRSLAYLIGDDRAPALCLALMLRHWDMTVTTLLETLAGDRFAPAFGSAPCDTAALQACQHGSLDNAPLPVRADIPDWLAGPFEHAFGAGWSDEAAALGERPPLDLRVNTLKADRGKVLKALAGTHAQATSVADCGLRIAATHGPARLPNVTHEPAFHKGWFEVQDEGSQIAARMVDPQPGEQILDYCAGAGGKTLALAAMMANKGQVHAFDSDRRRLAPMIARLKRAGTRNVQMHEHDGALAGLVGRCERVLVDAPCTGSGVWRRRPDTKWRLSPDNVVRRQQEQHAALAGAARYVRTGGNLIYVTCSLLPEENVDTIGKFLAAHTDFAMLDAARIWQTLFPDHRDAVRIVEEQESGRPIGLLLSPLRTGTDGFFIALMTRTGPRNGPSIHAGAVGRHS